MSFLNDCIKFHLNIEDPNIIFSDYFKKWINGKYHNLYLAELIQPHCPYCYSSNLKHNGHYTSKRKILSALTEDRSMTSIAREHNVSVNTVQRVLESCSSKFYDDFDHLPKHLAFDEFKGGVVVTFTLLPLMVSLTMCSKSYLIDLKRIFLSILSTFQMLRSFLIVFTSFKCLTIHLTHVVFML